MSPRARLPTATSPTWGPVRYRPPAAPPAARGAREVPPPGRPRRPGWALDQDTLALGIHVDFDHQERRPDVRPGPGTPPTGTSMEPEDRRPAWARPPELGLPVEAREPGSEASLGPGEA